MKILVVAHYFWPEPFRINQLVEDLISQSAEVTVLTGHPSYPEDADYPGCRPHTVMRERGPGGCEVVRVPVVPRGRATGVRLALNYLSFVASGILLGPWLLRRHRFDAVFVYCTTPAIQGFVALWFKFLRRVPVVQWVQDIWPEALQATGYVRSPLLLRLVGAATSWMYRRSDLVLGQSRSFVAMIRQRAAPIPAEHFPNPGERPSSTPGVALPLPPGKNIVFAGNIGRAQAMETVVAAAELLDGAVPVRFLLFGSGSMAGWVQAEAAARGLSNIELAGRYPSSAMPAIFQQAFALLLPLTEDQAVSQTIPSKLQSYMASGRPIIVAVNGEAADVVEEAGGGISCAAENPQALAEAIRRLHAMEDSERERMGQMARAYYERHYEPGKLAGELVMRLRQLVAHHKGVAS